MATYRWRYLVAMIAAPALIMTAVLLLVWTPGYDPGDSGLANAWPFVLALGAGLPFAWRAVDATLSGRVAFVIGYILLGAVALYFFIFAFNCGGRGLCP